MTRLEARELTCAYHQHTVDCLSQVYGVTVMVTPHPVYGIPLDCPCLRL